MYNIRYATIVSFIYILCFVLKTWMVCVVNQPVMSWTSLNVISNQLTLQLCANLMTNQMISKHIWLMNLSSRCLWITQWSSAGVRVRAQTHNEWQKPFVRQRENKLIKIKNSLLIQWRYEWINPLIDSSINQLNY